MRSFHLAALALRIPGASPSVRHTAAIGGRRGRAPLLSPAGLVDARVQYRHGPATAGEAGDPRVIGVDEQHALGHQRLVGAIVLDIGDLRHRCKSIELCWRGVRIAFCGNARVAVPRAASSAAINSSDSAGLIVAWLRSWTAASGKRPLCIDDIQRFLSVAPLRHKQLRRDARAVRHPDRRSQRRAQARGPSTLHSRSLGERRESHVRRSALPARRPEHQTLRLAYLGASRARRAVPAASRPAAR